MKQRQSEFNVILTKAVLESLSSISPSINSVVFFYLKNNRSIRSDNYIDDPEAFDEGLKKIFGFGAKVIEKKILEFLYMKLQVPQKIREDFKFADEVKKAQKLSSSTALIVGETQ